MSEDNYISIEELQKIGQLDLANEYQSSLQTIIDILDEIVLVFKDDKISIIRKRIKEKWYPTSFDIEFAINDVNRRAMHLEKDYDMHKNRCDLFTMEQTSNIENKQFSTEIAPIVGTEEQARDLVNYINEEAAVGEDSIWNVNIFGKTMEQMIGEGIQEKASKINDESQLKLQNTMEKIVNDSNGGMVCIII